MENEPNTQTDTQPNTNTSEPAGASTGGGDPKSNPTATESKKEPETKQQDTGEKVSAEELEAFKKWQESQKSDAEKQAAAIAKAEKARLDAESKISDYEAKFIALKNGVSADSIDDVIALAKLKTNKDTSLEQAVSAVLEKYPQFSNKQITTGIHTNNNSTSSISGVEAAFLAKNPDLKI